MGAESHRTNKEREIVSNAMAGGGGCQAKDLILLVLSTLFGAVKLVC